MSFYINDETLEKIRDSSDIVDIISEYLPLKKTGSNYMGLCPFHNEKTPSFSVNEAKQFFHCFGCGEGGDVVSFIMKKENLSFPEAAKFLADRLGIEVEVKSEDDKELRERMNIGYEINRQAARFFYNNLAKSKASLSYLYNRKINEKTIKQFGLGYALDDWESLYKHLRSLNFKDEDMLKLGLIGERNYKDSYYDKFRNRIIFPIIDIKGRVIGFGGRVLDNTNPKYLNSQETYIFNKGNNLYGLNLVNKFSDRKKIILVEGYMDVIALFSKGITCAVASLGTAFTERQAKLLKRFGQSIYICFDMDEAGINATLKAIEIIRRLDVEPRVILLGNYKDPDDFLKENSLGDFEKLVDSAVNHIDYKVFVARRKYLLDTVEGKIGFTKEISRYLKELRSPIEIDIYIKKISEELDISKEAIEKEVYGEKKSEIKFRKPKAKDVIKPVKIILPTGAIMAEIDLVKLMIYDKDFYDTISKKLDIEDYNSNECREIIKELNNLYIEGDNINEGMLFEDIKNKPSINPNILKEIKERELKFSPENIDQMIIELVNTIKINKLETKRKLIVDKIESIEKIEKKSAEEEKKFLDLIVKLTNLNKELDLIRYEEGR